MTLQDIRKLIASKLDRAGIEAADYESWVFLAWKLGIDRAEYYMDPLKEIEEEKMEDLFRAVSLREKRFPLQYLMQSSDFMGFDFYVDERVLIPRHDTECLVEEATSWLKDMAFLRKIQKNQEPLRVLDLCTGSGCIGISIKLLVADTQVYLADLSTDALAVASKNAKDLHVDVTILQGDLFEALTSLKEEKKFDLIISNPPYIPTKVVEGLMPEVKNHEPHMALDGTEDGLLFYRKITQQAPEHMNSGAFLMYEIGAEQGEDVSNMMRMQGFQEVSVIKDLAGLDRIVKGRLS